MASKISINLDTSKENFILTKCKQEDDLSLEACIYENGLALDLTNKEIFIKALKADNTYIIQNTNIIKEGNKINAELDRDFSRVRGTTKIEILLVEGGKNNTTFSFYLEVVGSVTKGAVESSNTVTILEELDKKVLEAGQVKVETEQLIATGGAATKGDITKVNSQLEQKLNKNGIVTMANMGQDVKTSMTGGSVAVVGRNAILTENIVDNQITEDKTNFITRTGLNLLNRKSTDNNFNSMVYTDGSIRTTPTWQMFVSHKIYVSAGQTVVWYNPYTCTVHQYSDVAYLGKGTTINTSPLTLVDGTTYIRIEFSNNMNQADFSTTANATLVLGTVAPTGYLPYDVYEIEERLIKGYIDNIKNDTANNYINKSKIALGLSNNLLDRTKLTSGFLGASGNITTSGAWWVTDFIPIPVEEKNISTANDKESGTYGAFYDGNKQLISTFKLWTGTKNIYPIVEGAKYFRLTIENTMLQNKMINFGTNIISYEEFTEKVDEKDIQPFKNKIVLPNNIYVAKGIECNIYSDNITYSIPNTKSIFFDTSIGNQYKRFYRYSPTTTKVDTVADISCLDENLNMVAQKRVTIKTIDTTSLPSNLNILCLGDSFTDMGGWCVKLKNNLESFGIVPNFVGTCKTTTEAITISGTKYNIKREALSGGKLNQFVTNTGVNPWWNSDTSQNDMVKYFTDNSLPTADVMTVQFTFNDITKYRQPSYKHIIDDIKTLYNAYKLANSNGKMVFSIEPPGAIDSNNLNSNMIQASVLAFAEELYNEFENSTDLYVAPSYACMDRINGYTKTQIGFSSLQGYYESVTQDSSRAVHPQNDTGMYQIGDCITSTLLALIKEVK